MLYATEQQMEFLTQRYRAWEAAGFPDIDPHLKEVVQLLNSFAGVVTVSCCEGHQTTRSKPASGFYMYLAATEEGYPVVWQLYQQLLKRIWGVSFAWEEEAARATQLIRQSFKQVHPKNLALVNQTREIRLEGEQLFYYHCFSLHAKNTHLHEIKANFLHELEEILKKLKED